MNLESYAVDNLVLPKFLVEDAAHVPDQQNLGDAGFDLRALITKQESESCESTSVLKNWLEDCKQLTKNKPNAVNSAQRTAFEPVIYDLREIFLDGSPIVTLDELKNYKVGIKEATKPSLRNEFRFLKSEHLDDLNAWFEKTLDCIESLEKTHDFITLFPEQSALINAGFKVALPEPTVLPLTDGLKIPVSFELDIHARSGLSVKHGLRIKNQTGIVDTGYRDTVKIALENTGSGIHLISNKSRVAQGVFRLCLNLGALPNYKEQLCVSKEEFESFSRNDRMGGFGSTGSN